MNQLKFDIIDIKEVISETIVQTVLKALSMNWNGNQLS
jgi:hypothetical protein